MNSKQIFMIVTIIVALSAAMIATPVMAQNMTGGNDELRWKHDRQNQWWL